MAHHMTSKSSPLLMLMEFSETPKAKTIKEQKVSSDEKLHRCKLVSSCPLHLRHRTRLTFLCRVFVHRGLARGMEQPECVWEPESDPRPNALQVRKHSHTHRPAAFNSLSSDAIVVSLFKPAQLSPPCFVSIFLPCCLSACLLCCSRLRQ